MSDLFLLSEAQMRRIEGFFPLSHEWPDFFVPKQAVSRVNELEPRNTCRLRNAFRRTNLHSAGPLMSSRRPGRASRLGRLRQIFGRKTLSAIFVKSPSAMTTPDAPPVPTNVDLRDFPFFPIDIARFFGSEFNAINDDGAWRAGMTLWMKSFHQVPAGSIPDDDNAQARLAELGRDLKTWHKIKGAALRHWIKCSDGRLYHPVVAEKALEAWIEKLGQRKSSAAGNAKRHGHDLDPAVFDAEIMVATRMLAALNPNSRLLTRRSKKSAISPPNGNDRPFWPHPDGTPDQLPSGSQGKVREEKVREEI